MLGVCSEFAYLSRYGDDGFLHHLLRLDVRESRLCRDVVDELPVRVEEILPTRVVAPILETVEQAMPRGNRVEGLFGHTRRRRFGKRLAQAIHEVANGLLTK